MALSDTTDDMELKIIDYNETYHDALFAYMKRTFLTYKDSYINYCIEESSGRQPSKLVVDENNVIRGCHLYYCTRACINGEIIDTQWGHDTYLDKDARPLIGPEFILDLYKIKEFGVGLTEVASKINKILKKVFFPGVFNYYTINYFLPQGILMKLLPIKRKKTNYPDKVVCRGVSFSKAGQSDELLYPNNGFWYQGINDIDFVRDSFFLNKRFFNNDVYKYHVYFSNMYGKESYFVVRDSEYRGIPALTISDFRYNPNSPKMTKNIIDAVHRIAAKNGIGIVYFVSGDRNMDKSISKMLHYKTPMEFVTANKIPASSTFSLTGGDSDMDFLKI